MFIIKIFNTLNFLHLFSRYITNMFFIIFINLFLIFNRVNLKKKHENILYKYFNIKYIDIVIYRQIMVY